MKKKNYFYLFIIGCLMLSLISCKTSEDRKELKNRIVLASINGEEITHDDFYAQFSNLPETANIGDNIYSLKLELLNSMINEIIILKYAAAHQISVTEEEVQQEYFMNFGEGYITDHAVKENLLNSIRRRLTIQAFIQKQFSMITVSEKEILEYYNKNSEEFYEPDEVSVQQIYVKDKEVADKIFAGLKAGLKFEQAAEENNIEPYNEDPAQIYVYRKGELPPEFEHAVFELGSGKYSKVIKSSYGYHIFKLKSKKLARVIKINEAEESIRTTIRNKKINDAFEEWILKERSRYEIKINQKFLEE